MGQSQFTHRRMVEFAETDAAGILHFANYFRYMEATEHAFFRSLGLRVHNAVEGAGWGWARGHVECQYLAPLRNEDTVELRLSVREKRTKSIVYDVSFWKVREGTAPDTDVEAVEVARGSMVTICVMRDPERGLKAVTMPDEVDRAIAVASS